MELGAHKRNAHVLLQVDAQPANGHISKSPFHSLTSVHKQVQYDKENDEDSTTSNKYPLRCVQLSCLTPISSATKSPPPKATEHTFIEFSERSHNTSSYRFFE